MSNQKYSHDKEFWSIPNPINSYWAGFCCSDGYLSRTQPIFRLGVGAKDLKHLEQFRRQTNFNGPVKINNEYPYGAYVLINSCPKWHLMLQTNFGVVYGKINRFPPSNLTEYLQWCFLIGFIDGKGSVFVENTLKQTLLRIIIKCDNIKIMNWVKILIESKFSKNMVRTVNQKLLFHKQAKSYVYPIVGLRACLMFKYLREFEVPKLSRKWNTLNVIKEMELKLEKYPNLIRYSTLNKV